MAALVRCPSPSCDGWFYLTVEEEELLARLGSESESTAIDCPLCGNSSRFRQLDVLDHQLTAYYDQLVNFGRSLGYLTESEAGGSHSPHVVHPPDPSPSHYLAVHG